MFTLQTSTVYFTKKKTNTFQQRVESFKNGAENTMNVVYMNITYCMTTMDREKDIHAVL